MRQPRSFLRQESQISAKWRSRFFILDCGIKPICATARSPRSTCRFSLNHPNIVQIIETYWDNEAPAVALEFVDGVSLEEFQGRLPYILPEISVRIVIEVLKALELAHSRGVIHRDLKPANILVGNDGRVLVTILDLRKCQSTSSRHTLSGTILGSPGLHVARASQRRCDRDEVRSLFGRFNVVFSSDGNETFLAPHSVRDLSRRY